MEYTSRRGNTCTVASLLGPKLTPVTNSHHDTNIGYSLISLAVTIWKYICITLTIPRSIGYSGGTWLACNYILPYSKWLILSIHESIFIVSHNITKISKINKQINILEELTYTELPVNAPILLKDTIQIKK